MGLIDKIKESAKNSGSSKSKFIYFREDEKKRIRFLQELDDGFEVVFHDSFEKGINVPCQEIYGKDCPHCNDDSLRTRSSFAWSVYDYDANEVKILMQPVNNCTAVPSIVSMYENYGTITDRDYVITKKGRQQNTSFSVIPMDKAKFRIEKAKALSKSAFLKYLAKAFPLESDQDEEIEKSMESNKKEVDEDDNEYDSLTPKELYMLCVERKIDAEKRKQKNYYINLLEEYDKAHDDWDDDDDWDDEQDDEWE